MSLDQTLRRLFGRAPRPQGRRDVPRRERHRSEMTVQLRTPLPPVIERVPSPAPAVAVSPPPPFVRREAETRLVREPAHSLVAVLIAIDGELAGEVYGVPDQECRIGRSATCEIELPSEWISREHVRLAHRGGVFALAPLAHDRPVLLNGQLTAGGELRDGDTLRIGQTTLRFRSLR